MRRLRFAADAAMMYCLHNSCKKQVSKRSDLNAGREPSARTWMESQSRVATHTLEDLESQHTLDWHSARLDVRDSEYAQAHPVRTHARRCCRRARGAPLLATVRIGHRMDSSMASFFDPKRTQQSCVQALWPLHQQFSWLGSCISWSTRSRTCDHAAGDVAPMFKR